MRKRHGRQRPLSGDGPGLGTGCTAEGVATDPPGGRIQPVAESAAADEACAAGAATLARGPGPIGTGEPPRRTGSPEGTGDIGGWCGRCGTA